MRPGGNLTSDGTKSYLYDVENRLVRVTDGPYVTHLYYDPMGRLYRTASTRPGYGTTVYLHDGDALVAEYDAAGTMLRRHVHGAAAGVDDPLATFAGSGTDGSTAALLKADPRGSIVATTDWNGNLQVINTYDVYGIPGSANSGRFQYTGQVWLPEIGLYYYKARIYSPSLGRFLQTDPIGYEDDVNLYAYVADDPVNAIDPDGKGKITLLRKVIRYFTKKDGTKVRVETSKKLKTEKQAVRVRKKGGNVVVKPKAKGAPTSSKAKTIERKASGRGNVVRHDPHKKEGGRKDSGDTESHYQPAKRAGGEEGMGHTIYKGLGYLTATQYLGDDSLIAQGIDAFNPASDVQAVVGIVIGEE